MAYQALTAELDIGALLPYDVVVYEEIGGSVIGIVNPVSMLGVVDSADLDPIANEAQNRLKRVKTALEQVK